MGKVKKRDWQEGVLLYVLALTLLCVPELIVKGEIVRSMVFILTAMLFLFILHLNRN